MRLCSLLRLAALVLAPAFAATAQSFTPVRELKNLSPAAPTPDGLG